ncbi:hypothetical protein QBC40DRAFT_167382 [Triangularia verruculosa]|uniref:Uncharacterized protein n=1 Tax=Triangularia verruculosa TaxID=2587418 RepID=A0AAN6XM30_9PEZI|nr:hypothetical protein QBC40DRAFT_167382 [Triangularia verruculosa]
MGDGPAESAPSEAISQTATPAPGPASTSVPPRGRSTTATPAPKAGPKFKPKAVRRSSAERERIARELGQIAKVKDEAEERRKARLAKAIVRGRGRGGFRGGSRGPVAAGPLSGGMTFGDSSGRGRFARADFIKGEGGRAFGSDGRVNADLLHDYVPDDEDDDKERPLMPMGIRRIQPKSEEDAEKDDKDAKGEEDSDEEGLFVNEKERAEMDRQAAAKQAGRIKSEAGSKNVDMASIPPRFAEAEEIDYDNMLRVETSQKLNISSGKAEELRRQRHLFSQQLDDRAFIFQFPVRPPLYVVKDDGSLTKSEDDGDVVMLDGQQQSNTPIDLTTEVKEEEVAEAEDENREEEPEAVPQAGYLGKLIVRKSGKVEIDWGGYRMDSGTGVAPRHLSTAVLLEMEEAKPGEAPRGFAYSMGRVEAVFSSVLRTSDMEPWVVDNQVSESATDA